MRDTLDEKYPDLSAEARARLPGENVQRILEIG